MKLINNPAEVFFSTFCPSFYEKKNKKKNHARLLSAHVYTIQDSKNASYRKIMHARPGVQVNSACQELSWLPMEGENKFGFLQKRNPKRGAATII